MNIEENARLSEAERIAWSKVYKVEQMYAKLQTENNELREELDDQRKLYDDLMKKYD